MITRRCKCDNLFYLSVAATKQFAAVLSGTSGIRGGETPSKLGTHFRLSSVVRDRNRQRERANTLALKRRREVGGIEEAFRSFRTRRIGRHSASCQVNVSETPSENGRQEAKCPP